MTYVLTLHVDVDVSTLVRQYDYGPLVDKIREELSHEYICEPFVVHIKRGCGTGYIARLFEWDVSLITHKARSMNGIDYPGIARYIAVLADGIDKWHLRRIW